MKPLPIETASRWKTLASWIGTLAAGFTSAFFVAPLHFNYSTRHFTVFQFLFNDMRALHNLMPYATWSPGGEFVLLLLNPGFALGVCIGIFKIRALRDFWLPLAVVFGFTVIGLIFMMLAVLAMGGSNEAGLGFYALFYQAIAVSPYALLGGILGGVVGSRGKILRPATTNERC